MEDWRLMEGWEGVREGRRGEGREGRRLMGSSAKFRGREGGNEAHGEFSEHVLIFLFFSRFHFPEFLYPTRNQKTFLQALLGPANTF